MSHPIAVKTMSPGRIVLVSHGLRDKNCLGMLVEVDARSKTKSYSVLVLKSSEEGDGSTGLKKADEERYFRFLSLYQESTARPDGDSLEHELVTVKCDGLAAITGKTVKVDCAKVLSDLKQRQIPRFRDAPVGQSTGIALQELVRLSQLPVGDLDLVVVSRDFKIQDIDMLSALKGMETAKENIMVL